MACHNAAGHGSVDLHDAIMRSCNGYFAWLGEQQDERAFQALAASFGFGQPTGVRFHPERGGLREDTCSRHLFENLHGSRLLMAGNGLGVVNVTPMQIARAYAGLATGALPEMRLVERVGGESLPRRSRPLGYSEAALAIVRDAMRDVAALPGGSGHEALNQRELGFAMCAKTGSADLSDEPVLAADGKEHVRKHTWVAGWFPPEEPVAVLVVFVDDTLAKASQSAVWIARQYLQRPELQAFARAELRR
jgi:penicillin-binding protein 2